MLAAAGSLVWGTKMASIEKLRDRQSLALRWPSLDGSTQQPTKGWWQRRGRGGGDRTLGYNKGVGGYPIAWGVKLRDGRIKIERRTGPWVKMAATGGGDTTTNQQLASAVGYSWAIVAGGDGAHDDHDGVGRYLIVLGHQIEGRKKSGTKMHLGPRRPPNNK